LYVLIVTKFNEVLIFGDGVVSVCWGSVLAIWGIFGGWEGFSGGLKLRLHCMTGRLKPLLHIQNPPARVESLSISPRRRTWFV